jgi:hypothetical protein
MSYTITNRLLDCSDGAVNELLMRGQSGQGVFMDRMNRLMTDDGGSRARDDEKISSPI